MNQGPLCAPTSDNSRSRKLVVKKLTSILLAVLMVSLAALKTAGDSPMAPDESKDADSIRLGLSRQRPAFRKALSMLAEAALVNPRLADYYGRVTKRVNGDAADAEQNMGVIVTARKADPVKRGAGNVKPAPASLSSSQAPLQSLIPVAQAAAIAEPQSSPGDSKDDASGFVAEGGQSSEAPLTVGDITFDTNPVIEQWMTYYGATPIGRSTFKIGIERGASYLEMARAEFRGAGVPEDLVWLAFVESVWNPRAVSPAAAGGIWQFISATATEYGLKVGNGNDERADPFKQTHVAAVYLRDLYVIFGDWTLAMAAYNAGEPGVMGAIIRNGNANYWELRDKNLLPRETCNYVPKILAAIRVASQAEFYGLAPIADAPVLTAG